MSQRLTVQTEQVDDVPILIADMRLLTIPTLIDEHFTMHGNWQGLSLGEVSIGWLAHILTKGDHRLNRVADWITLRTETLRGCYGGEVRAADFADDRLAMLLDKLSDDERWASFEAALNRRTLRVYDLKPKCVRLDSTTASGYWKVTEDGLFQFGYSKDNRPDQPQVKVMMATLDPLGMPVVVHVVPGEKADDPLYIPAIDQVRRGVEKSGLLYVGDCKLMSFQTRVHLQAGNDFYLGPFSKVQIPDEVIEVYLQPVREGKLALIPVYRSNQQGEIRQIAEGYEAKEMLIAVVGEKTIVWTERRLIVRSLAHARSSTEALHARLMRAESALTALSERRRGKERLTEIEQIRQAVEAIVRKYDVEGLFDLSYVEQIEQHSVRKYGERPAEMRSECSVVIQFSRNETAIQQAISRLGWRVYGTNQPSDELSLEQAVLAYREEYLIERNFGRLKGEPLSLTPMYLQEDHRVTGLIRLLSVGLRVLTLMEGVVRHKMAETGEKLAGLYAGNPKRTTARPTAEAIQQAFKNIYINVVRIGGQVHRHVTPLSDLQLQILALMGLSPDIYRNLVADFPKPT
jgi:transposase